MVLSALVSMFYSKFFYFSHLFFYINNGSNDPCVHMKGIACSDESTYINQLSISPQLYPQSPLNPPVALQLATVAGANRGNSSQYL